nr:HIT family protein [uncultured Lachnoclostridium sp.]
MSDNSCIFCKLASGEFSSATVYEDDLFRAILDISPAAKGHTLLLPKTHAVNLFELDELEVSKALLVAKKLAAATQKTLQCDGINILQNNGTAAGQSVFHFHIHLIPRYEEDGVTIPWKSLSYSDGEAFELANKIHQNL